MNSRIYKLPSLLAWVCVASVLTLSAPLAAATPAGSLVIVGGALSRSNAEVYRSFIQRAGAQPRIGIVPAASGNPATNARSFADILSSYGVPATSIEILPLALIDDPETPGVDESQWRENAVNESVVKAIQQLTAVWFLGGDQTRITTALMDAKGGDTPALAAIREVYARGGVIGGTSAGAAIQSSLMITGGSSTGALLEGSRATYGSMKEQEAGAVSTGKGLGFLPQGVIDQHFDSKARLGRLIVVLLESEGQEFLGYGIDEDTALIFDASTNQLTVAGRGQVTRVQTIHAKQSGKPTARRIENVTLDLLSAGDGLNLTTGEVRVDPERKPTVGHEYFSIPKPSAQGVFNPYGGSVGDVIGNLLVDNDATDTVDSFLWDEKGRGYRIRFSKTADTRGYYGGTTGKASYSVTTVRLDLLPVAIKIKERR
ncbi:MAG: cyanophycinase [Verrucomicrobiota bacterium]|nr:cyanophycinase [Verrucomicrobiota bacterium]